MSTEIAVTFFIAIWGMAALIIGDQARQRGSTMAGWFILSLLISPILTFPIMLIATHNGQNRQVG